MAKKLLIEKLAIGKGKAPEQGDTVVVHYTGCLLDGTKFDSSLDHGEPFEFTLGIGEVIPGWDEGLSDLRVGDRVKLTIPPDLGYGVLGVPGLIPSNATLVFEIELLDVK